MISFQRRYQENTKLLTVCKWIADLLIVILLAYTLTLFLCDRTTISGNSMQPAIENEDTVLLNRIAYSFHGPKRYSIIAFHPNGVKTSKIYVKRLAAGELTLGENEYFVLGDNRNNSEDSRFANVGVVKKDDIVGSVWFIASPMKRMRLL